MTTLKVGKFAVCFTSDERELVRCIYFIHAEMKRRLVADLNAADFYAMSADEASSKYGHKSHLDVCVKYIKDGVPTSCLFTVVELDGWTADKLTQAIVGSLEAAGVKVTGRMSSFTSDGASAFSSRGQGVAGKLIKQINASMFTTHCVAHRVDLSIEDLASDPRFAKIIAEVDQLLKDANSLFNRSSKRWQEYDAVAELLGCSSRTFKVFVKTR